ncbi:MAG: hypothetical protein KFH98_03735 [Gemmatimonadetes bacterium]|nr:hypothetical protein [Gemmatimonadota bacterium]
MPRPQAKDPAQEAGRTEPGTWHEIIARFERDMAELPEHDAEEGVSPADDAGVITPSGTPVDDAGEMATAAEGSASSPTPPEDRHATPVADDTGAVRSEAPPPEVDEPAADIPDEREPVAPGDPSYLDAPEPWEVRAMTTPDYIPPQTIHDAGHDDWPVDADDGSAVPVNGATDDEDLELIGELLLDEVVPADPWDTEAEPDEPDDAAPFPLDAFIVPAGVQNVSGYGDSDVAQRVAHRLDELARRLRDDGLSSLGDTAGVDELSRVLAAIVTGYVAGDKR